jgi:hypothetical protein
VTIIRWAAIVIAIFCLAIVTQTGRYDGVWLFGVIAMLVFLATWGFFSRRFWTVEKRKPEHPDRTQHAAARMWLDLQVDDLDRDEVTR